MSRRALRRWLAVAIAAVVAIAGHDALMAGLPAPAALAAAGHAATASEHRPELPSDPRHPDRCWTSRAAIPADRVAGTADFAIDGPAAAGWSMPGAIGMALVRGRRRPSANRAPPRAALQIWRV